MTTEFDLEEGGPVHVSGRLYIDFSDVPLRAVPRIDISNFIVSLYSDYDKFVTVGGLVHFLRIARALSAQEGVDRFVVKSRHVDRTHALILVGSFLAIHKKKSIKKIIKKLGWMLPAKDRQGPRFIGDFHKDATCVPWYEYVGGFAEAVSRGWISLDSFNVEDYYHLSGGNVDMTPIIPGKLVAFAEPGSRHIQVYQTLAKKFGVKLAFKLNEEDAKYDLDTVRRETGVIVSADIGFADNTAPSETVVQQFLINAHQAIKAGEAVGIHCRGGIGRTGTLAAAYLMKYEGFAANEAIGYLRLMRPLSVSASQQPFLLSLEKGV